MMEGKKISFGFIKTKKVERPVIEESKDFIECVEEKSIKIVGGEKVEEKEPLVIPMKPNTLITAEKLKEIAAKVESSLEESGEDKDETKVKLEPTDNETLDQMAVRELLQEAQKEVKVETEALTVPIPAKPVIDGQKEATLQDYESVPIQDFGMAMLRGMGWTPAQEKLNKYKPPQLRPKGLGLGADKVISDKQKKKTTTKDGKEEELFIIKNAFVKIIAGKHAGYYGKVISLDEENGRVMVDLTVKKETVSLSEFMMQPVTKSEFDKESKVINTEAYAEYKKKENAQNQNSSRKESSQVTGESRHDSRKGREREASSSKSNEISKDYRKEVKEERRRGNDNSSNGTKEKSRRNSTEDRSRSRKDKNKRDSSSSEDRSRRKTERTRRGSSGEERSSSRKKKEKSRRDSSGSAERSDRKKREKAKRDSSSEDKSIKAKEKVNKKYSSNESLSSLSDSEKKKKHKNHRRRKDSSDTATDSPKKDKRDIDKKRKGKKKKRDRDRSPNYKKHRK